MGIAFIVSIILFSNCQKNVDTIYQDVSFSLNNVSQRTLKSSSNFKSTNSDTIVCSDLNASYVSYVINSEIPKTIPVFYINGLPYTSSIKLPVGLYTLNEFLVYNDNNTPLDLSDDILLSAAPHTNSIFSTYVTTPLSQSFAVQEDIKLEVKLDVVCFTPQNYEKFGFTYFQFNKVIVKELQFFGDFCIKAKEDYAGSLYSQQTNWGTGVGYIDAPAIFKVEVWRNGILQNSVNNSTTSKTLGVWYGDRENQTDNFEVKLFILVKQGTSFNYVYFKSWMFNDNSNISTGNDGRTDFVLGNCYDPANPPDLILAPYMNLPITATYTITGNWAPGSLGAYVNAQLTNIGNGYDISNGTYPSNCADHQTVIYVGTPYNMDVYSSLYQDQLPLFTQSNKWNKINWLYNHLSWYPGYHWYDVQGFIWLYDSNVWNGQPYAGMPALTAMSQQMKLDADTYGSNYSPLPGGWAAIIFVPVGTAHNATSATVQTMFIQVDP